MSRRLNDRVKGWTPERRARQAALIARWQPWRRSTGPRTQAGRARSAANALKHGLRGRAHLEEMRQVREKMRDIRRLLRISALNIAIAKAFLRARAAGQPTAFPSLWRAGLSDLKAAAGTVSNLQKRWPRLDAGAVRPI